MEDWNHPGFDGLVDLSQRDGVDIRPTLLRVITDSYLQNLSRAPQDELQYSELASRLLDETDVATRSAISMRLAHERKVPRAIILQLARDVLEVAEPVLRHSPVLTREDCETIARERGRTCAEIISERERAATRSGSQPASQTTEAVDAATEASLRSEAEELCELFFAAGSSERRLILTNLDYSAIEASTPPEPLQRTDIWRIETASLRHEIDKVGHEIHQALGVSHAIARRIVDDELGEPIAVAGKAMVLPADVMQRMILFLNPRVGQSVDRVYQLSSLYSEVSVDAARRMVTLWRRADPAPIRPVQYESLAWRHAAENTRRALSQISHSPAQRAWLRRDGRAHFR